MLGWAEGNNEGIYLNDVNRSGFARWFVHASESAATAKRPKLTIEYTPALPGMVLVVR